MLLELTINDFAIIDRLRIDTGPGLTVLTGETGAGKSIIIDALGALLGARVGPEYIREGATGARVEGIFDLPEPVPASLHERLEEYGLEPEDGTIVLGRELSRTRGVARANGRAVPVAALQSVGGAMVVIHGQTDHLALLRSADQLNLLDRFAGLQPLRAAMAGVAARLRQVRAERAALARDEREAARRLDMLRYQIDEIERAGVRSGEDDELEQEIQVLAGAERLQELASQALALLSGDGADEPAAHDLLGRVEQTFQELVRIDQSRHDLAAAATSLLEQAQDLARDVRHYHDAVEHDPERLAAAQDRLDLLKQLKRKYGATIEEILAFHDEAAREAEQLAHREERQSDLEAEEARLVEEATETAGKLHAARVAAGRALAERVERELQDLAMRGARFRVALHQTPDPEGLPCPEGETFECAGPYAFDATGVDRAEFLVAPNIGESLKPAAKIASGGETSRMMLALQSVLSEADETPTLVFDEVDVGVGGRSGRVLGEKLWELARRRQVFCITHLPQVAAYGDDHVTVVKEVSEGRTRTVVRRLEGAARFEEVAQMLGGHRAGDTASAAARDLLLQAEAWKRDRQRSGAA